MVLLDGVLTLLQGKRLFIKDITYYLLPPDGAPSSIAPTLARKERGVGTQRPHIDGASSEANGVRRPYPYKTESEPGNPTVIPEDVLKKFHFTFLIRHPKHSIPSFYRCTIPPLDEMTGFYNYMPSEAGYGELRRFFDHLRSTGQVGPSVASYENHDAHLISNGTTSRRSDDVEICVVDADDLLDNPAGIIQAYCKSVGMHYDKSMLSWSTEKDEKQAREAFEKWKGFHEDAIGSCDLKPRAYVGYNFNMHSRRTADRCFDQKKKLKTREEENAEWTEKFGEEGAKVIRETVDANLEDYEYLKQFALNV